MRNRIRTLITTTATVAALAGSAGAAVANGSMGAGVPATRTPTINGVNATVPAIETPGCSRYCPGDTTADVPDISTPAVRSLERHTDPLRFSPTCVGALACVGSFTVPSISTGPTPEVDRMTVAGPSATVESPCTATPATANVCNGLELQGFSVALVPSVDSQQVAPAISARLYWNTLHTAAPAAGGDTQYIAPISRTLDVPLIGSVPVTLFPQGLRIPATEGTAAQGHLTLVITVGGATLSQAIPVDVAA